VRARIPAGPSTGYTVFIIAFAIVIARALALSFCSGTVLAWIAQVQEVQNFAEVILVTVLVFVTADAA
jgi:hypothetical protein